MKSDVGFFLSEWVITEFLVKQCVLHHQRFGIKNRVGAKRGSLVGFAGFKAHLRFEPLTLFIHQRDQDNR